MDINTHNTIQLNIPRRKIGFLQHAETSNTSLDVKDLALNLLTDFRLSPAISVLASTQIDGALTQMVCSGVRLLFAVDPTFRILGNITSYDIQGEKPMRYLQSRDCRIGICSRDDVQVYDIMTPVQQWKVVDYEQLRMATIADILPLFIDHGQRHLIVVESVEGSFNDALRGLISLTTVERAIGANIQSTPLAKSFADIKSALGA